MRPLRQVREGIRGGAESYELRVRRHPRYHLRLRLHQEKPDKGNAQIPPEHDVALPRAAARRGDNARYAAARGLEPALRRAAPCFSAGTEKALGQGRRPEPDGFLKGPRQRHGGRQGWGGGREDYRLLVHGQCGELACGQCRGCGHQDLYLRPRARAQG